MSVNDNSSKPVKVGAPVVLEVGDDRHPPSLVWRGSLEESFRPVPTEDIQWLLNSKVMGAESRAAALAELARRGIVPPQV
jgi:hypothetical protein